MLRLHHRPHRTSVQVTEARRHFGALLDHMETHPTIIDIERRGKHPVQIRPFDPDKYRIALGRSKHLREKSSLPELPAIPPVPAAYARVHLGALLDQVDRDLAVIPIERNERLVAILEPSDEAVHDVFDASRLYHQPGETVREIGEAQPVYELELKSRKYDEDSLDYNDDDESDCGPMDPEEWLAMMNRIREAAKPFLSDLPEYLLPHNIIRDHRDR